MTEDMSRSQNIGQYMDEKSSPMNVKSCKEVHRKNLESVRDNRIIACYRSLHTVDGEWL